ncbi:MAG: ABC transporter permease, partial [Lawsonibacter sp.]
ELAFWGIFVAILIAIPLGILAARKQNTWIDSGSMFFGLLGLSIPNFWLGLMLIILFAQILGWLPSFATQSWKSIILPSITIGTGQAALLLRTTRSSMLEIIRQDYLRTARAKGVSEHRVIYHHALRNALIPIITAAGSQFSVSLGGAVVTESVFAWPGVGRLIIDSINTRDEVTVVGSIMLTTMLSSFVILG